jgi:CheY-like chemotaxis protein
MNTFRGHPGHELRLNGAPIGASCRSLARRRDEPPHRRSSRDLRKRRAKKADRLAEPLKEKGELILVVDDEAVILRLVKMILQGVKYRVLCASDGAEAIKIFTQHISIIKAVVTDINMPCMDGIALIRAIAHMNADVTFVAITGGEESARMSDLKSLGVENFLMKPFNIDKLLKTLLGALTSRPCDPVELR